MYVKVSILSSLASPPLREVILRVREYPGFQRSAPSDPAMLEIAALAEEAVRLVTDFPQARFRLRPGDRESEHQREADQWHGRSG